MKQLRCAVAIIGGGAAGIAAAISAARAGKDVCLIERSERLGGSGTNAIVGTICGLSRCGASAQTPAKFDNPGFAKEFAAQVATRSSSHLMMNARGLTYLPYLPNEFEAVSQEILLVHKNITQLLRTTLQGVTRNSLRDTFTLCVKDANSLTQEITTDAIVDCSGNATALTMLGLATTEPKPIQAAALVFQLGGLPSLDENTLAFAIRKTLREGALRGELPETLTYVSIVPGSLQSGCAYFNYGLAGPNALGDPLADNLAIAAIERSTHHHIATVTQFLQERSEIFSNVQCIAVAPSLGIRSGRRGIGSLTLSEQSVRLSERFIDGIALGFWPAEIWNTPVRPEVIFPEAGCAYEIPLGALCSQECPGVYFAGRCLSASDYAIASARVIGTCFSTGYAAGRIAVGFLRGETPQAIVAEIRAYQVEPFYRSTAYN